MANILDYLEWRGDLSFNNDPVSDIDFLIFSRLAYIPFDRIVYERPTEDCITLGYACSKVLENVNNQILELSAKEDSDLLRLLQSSARFSELEIACYTKILNEDIEEQFAAVTFILPDKTCVIAFRGTDSTVIGWKEDLNMGFAGNVPSQLDSVKYIDRIAEYYKKKIMVCGHSKGGNLAIYASTFCSTQTKKLIAAVRNMDGPGFNENVSFTTNYTLPEALIRTYVPQSSIVGMLLEHNEEFTIIHSTRVGILQHDVYSWQLIGNQFETMENLTDSSQFIDKLLKNWLIEMNPDLREKMIDGLYNIISSSDSVTIKDLINGKNVIPMIKAASSLDDETRNSIIEAFRLLKNSLKVSLPEFTEKQLPAKSKI